MEDNDEFSLNPDTETIDVLRRCCDTRSDLSLFKHKAMLVLYREPAGQKYVKIIKLEMVWPSFDYVPCP